MKTSRDIASSWSVLASRAIGTTGAFGFEIASSGWPSSTTDVMAKAMSAGTAFLEGRKISNYQGITASPRAKRHSVGAGMAARVKIPETGQISPVSKFTSFTSDRRIIRDHY